MPNPFRRLSGSVTPVSPMMSRRSRSSASSANSDANSVASGSPESHRAFASPSAGASQTKQQMLDFRRELIQEWNRPDPEVPALSSMLQTGGTRMCVNNFFYRRKLTAFVQRFGIDFIENLAIIAMQETLESCLPGSSNMVLARLLYLYWHTEPCSRKTSGEHWHEFPFHPASLFAHGKRVMITSHNIESLYDWIFGQLHQKPSRRLSSHSLSISGSTITEGIGLTKAISPNSGFNVAIFGEDRFSPYTRRRIMADGSAGHLCIVKNKRASGKGAMLLGSENSKPLKTDQQGSSHGANCSSNEWSAMFLPKFGDPLFKQYAADLPLPEESTNCLRVECNDFVFLSDGEVLNFVRTIILSDDQLKPLFERRERSLSTPHVSYHPPQFTGVNTDGTVIRPIASRSIKLPSVHKAWE